MEEASQHQLGDIEKTAWAREFVADSPVSYVEALKLARDPNLAVDVESATTVEGEPCFAILVADRTRPFWMDHKPTKKAALALCKDMGWRVRRALTTDSERGRELMYGNFGRAKRPAKSKREAGFVAHVLLGIGALVGAGLVLRAVLNYGFEWWDREHAEMKRGSDLAHAAWLAADAESTELRALHALVEKSGSREIKAALSSALVDNRITNHESDKLRAMVERSKDEATRKREAADQQAILAHLKEAASN